MAHLSLYRKYRSQTFADLVGQSHVTQTLRNALVDGRIAHAYLFSGPRGTGKTSTARILAKALNCESGGPEPDNTCQSCIAITDGSSLDVVEIDAASHGSVDDARELKQRVTTGSVGGRWKVFIIDECHMLSPAANNALLKVLEEPPSHVVFVFATTEPHKVLQTVLDRCQRYNFRSIGVPEVAELVERVVAAEGLAIEEDAVQLIAARAQGSARDALSLLDQLTSFAGDKITVEDFSKAFGSVPSDILFEIVDLVGERDIGAVFLFADRLVRSGADMREFVHAFVDHLRSLFLIMNTTGAKEILDTTDERLERLQAQANRFDSAEVLRLIDLAGEAGVQLRQAADGRLTLEVALARMARPELHATPSSLMARIQALEESIAAGGPMVTADRPQAASVGVQKPVSEKARPKPERAKTAVPEAADVAEEEVLQSAAAEPPRDPSSIDIDRVRNAWPVILEKVKRRKISFQALLLPATPVAYQDGELVLEFNPRSRFHKDKVADPAQHIPLVEAFDEVLGIKPKIRCVLGEEAPAPAPAEAVEPSADELSGDEGEPVGKPKRDPVDLIRETFKDTEVVGES